MRALWRQRALLALGVLVAASGLLAQALGQARPSGALDPSDDGPEGALALARWLETMGVVVPAEAGPEDLRSGDLLLVLSPARPFDRPEAAALAAWVRAGGVLVYHPQPSNPLGRLAGQPTEDALQMELGVRAEFTGDANPSAVFPFFTDPPAERFAVSGLGISLRLQHAEWTPLLASTLGGTAPQAAVRPLGRGFVYAVADPAFFSNGGIGQRDNAALVLNIVARHRPARAVFERGHRDTLRPPDLLSVLRTSPWGWSLYYAAAVTFAFVAWGGRRFGPAITVTQGSARSAGDYVTAFAGLVQRARATGWAQQQFAGLYRRRLARRLGMPPTEPLAALAARYAQRRPDQAEQLRQCLAQLEGPPLGERALLHQVRALQTLLNDLGKEQPS